MANHHLYEGREEQEIRCSKCGCMFWVKDPEGDDAEWDEAMEYFGIDQDCDVQLVRETLSS